MIYFFNNKNTSKIFTFLLKVSILNVQKCDDIDLYRSKPKSNDVITYMKQNSHWLSHLV